MKIGTLTIALLALAASHAFAAPVLYELNKDHTDITFQISHAGFTMKHGSFADMSGTLNWTLITSMPALRISQSRCSDGDQPARGGRKPHAAWSY